ncbi:hypothetical protein DB30_04739 [Enhygromyxa salina]|uniref:Secreted protein n=1 Tax=Enhygromyxa salina TaxID=215803 RepID=A0A0C1ZF65_9BACT|nr:hypothetical protein [Enhygromyxa salina]KIG16279.1 hypothetical protein DB30_04739 [Enhygromyxa salina]
MAALHRAALTLCSLSILSLSGVACVASPPQANANGKANDNAKPEVVCKHVRDVAAKTNSDVEALDVVQRECVETLSQLSTRYQTFTTCVDLAGDATAVLQCEEALAKPRSLLAAASPTAKLEALCDHMLGLVWTELGEMANNMTPDEFKQLRDKCVSEAASQIEAKGAEQFNKEAECIMAGQNLKDIEGCKL